MEILGAANDRKVIDPQTVLYNENVILYEQFNESVLLCKGQSYCMVLGCSYMGSLTCSLFRSQTFANFAYMLITF